ncbi:hypothetical protein CO057_01875 [Candidatus Uhrbacteria bacterium CG_4_9_14_0_2_um_filter_41_50]|uniref:DUF5673 domain-containing protein n=1 Tax=Candidatus Uhrbacteria bacterium CG_4_9_14_0_2_um_filter_41_50 TaxID=1975031 RepID=A0A2M8EPG4_9BACT|nr:MAG: hypothetical protein COZ45_01195 [Candidatus Uhrbacteria bacterium CG_4_10_14_3_um_filter_41_21]PIZ54879.1 MAG: hypothetical protein COY24_02310 [Candidatus Uhrbacteria bacterium CG_4_10_14_0_2_um_filter_41_21]PJB84717.1 MAG: hypothetical protein CO086_02195 [Candidatus Uhrbacteria bacterium CG_4_9_14_0_8_um_filter_41_16]PJC24633.1 MAG: hypothetical protein CO057_01875 [Candidatus Uhrbacteria bacterium CG_4_9_14_0_2_um_filter_41_50]PJE75405.1 MAG: hypothetical protein COV03_00365 [Candi
MENEHDPQEHIEDNGIDVGVSQISWETWESTPHERSRSWFIIASIIGAVLLVYAIAIGNYLFAVIVLMMGIILLINNLKHPDRLHVHVTDAGIVVGHHFYDFKDIKDFSIIYEPPEIKILYVDFNSVLEPLLVLPLDDVDPNEVREALLPYTFENLDREEETLTDMVRRMYKL